MYDPAVLQDHQMQSLHYLEFLKREISFILLDFFQSKENETDICFQMALIHSFSES